MSQTKNSQYKEEKKAIESAFDKLKNKTGEIPVLALAVAGKEFAFMIKGLGANVADAVSQGILQDENCRAAILFGVARAMHEDEEVLETVSDLCTLIKKEYETTRPETVS